MKHQKMMDEQDVVNALKFGKELPHLKDQFQQVSTLCIMYVINNW
jgi:hypothetical protein